MKVVYICSPLRGDLESNIKLAHSYCNYAISQGVIPIAPHTIYIKYLDDEIPDERETGIKIGLELLKRCDEVWVFGDVISEGMAAEIEHAKKLNTPIIFHKNRVDFNKKYQE